MASDDPSKVSAVDFTYLAAQTFGDLALERELLTLFVAQAVAILESLSDRNAHDQDDAAHRLKGSARAIGATSVARCADAYEQAGAEGRAANPSLFRDLSAAIEAARTTIQAHMAP